MTRSWNPNVSNLLNAAPLVTAGLGLAIATPAWAGFTEDFEAIADGTLIHNVNNWDGPVFDPAGSPQSDVTVRQDSLSQSGTNVATVPGLGSAGYNGSKGLEHNYQDQFLRTLTGSEIVSTVPGNAQLEMKIRIADLQQLTDGSNSDAPTNHRFVLYAGQGITYNTSTETMNIGPTVNALAVEFWNVNNNTRSIRYSKDGVDGFNPNSTADFDEVPNSEWDFDTWYTVRLSNIIQDEINAEYGTATLDVFESDSPGNSIVSGQTIYAHPGTFAWTGSWEQIDSIGFRSVGGNGFTSIDDMSLIPEPASLGLLLAGVTAIARRRRGN